MNNKLKIELLSVVGVITSLLMYVTILTVPISQEISLAIRTQLAPIMVAMVLFYPIYRLRGQLWAFSSFTATLILFALPLADLWNSGANANYFIIGGLLPWSDANGYYYDATRILEGNTFSFWGSSHRPLSFGLLATLLWFTQQNLQVALALLVLIVAISCFFLTREVQRSHGTVPSLLMLMLLFLFIRGWIGTTMTENVGLALGTTGLAVMWRGIGYRHINTILLGILLLTLALNARAGAFFVLPALVLWGTWVFRGHSRISLHFLVGSLMAITLGFLINTTVLKVAGHPNAVTQSNFSYTLYGLATGGKGWTQIYVDHPELKAIEFTPEFYQKVYQLAWEAICTNPSALINVLITGWYAFLSPATATPFDIGGIGIPIMDILIRFSYYILGFLGFLSCYCQRQQPYNSLILMTILGTILSAPFLTDGGIRVYAATIAFSFLLPTLGTAKLSSLMTTSWSKILNTFNPVRKKVNHVVSPFESNKLILWVIVLVGLTLFGPIAVVLISTHPQFVKEPCTGGLETAYVRITSGSSVTLVEDGAIAKTRLPRVRVSDFKKYNSNSEILSELFTLVAGTTIMNLSDLTKFTESKHVWEGTLWLIADSKLVPSEPGVMKVCGKWSPNKGTYNKIFYADSIQKISNY